MDTKEHLRLIEAKSINDRKFKNLLTPAAWIFIIWSANQNETCSWPLNWLRIETIFTAYFCQHHSTYISFTWNVAIVFPDTAILLHTTVQRILHYNHLINRTLRLELFIVAKCRLSLCKYYKNILTGKFCYWSLSAMGKKI